MTLDFVSPLRRALEGAEGSRIGDLSLDGKVEIRGDLSLFEIDGAGELIWLTPRRGLLLVEGDPIERARQVREQGLLAYDMTAALAGLELEGERFRVYFPQELGHYVAESVLDAIAGLDNR